MTDHSAALTAILLFLPVVATSGWFVIRDIIRDWNKS